ncbi:ankyrin repeat-containing domain protein [Aspergillus varians]
MALTKLLAASPHPHGNEIISTACKSGNEAMVHLLLDAGCDPNNTDKFGRTLLFHAVDGNHRGLVVFLLQAGADVNARQSAECWFGLLGHAVVSGFSEVAMLSIEGGAGDVAVLERVVGGGGGVDIDLDQGAPVVWACKGRHARAVRLLLENGARIEGQEAWGLTAVTAAEGETALCLAVMYGHANVVLALLDDGPPLETWRWPELGHTSTYKYQPQYYEYLDAPENHGRTTLYHATVTGYVEIVRMLLSRGSTAMAVQATGGHSALLFATRNTQIPLLNQDNTM